MQSFNAQFANPRGLLGNLVGHVMAFENRERNRWAISLLDLQRADRVLEVGFGPGWAIRQMGRVVTAGLVAGVDSSETMVRQAGRRNAAGVRDGRVQLKHGSAAALPFEAATFDKALAVNSLHIWPDALAGLKEVQRVLKPGGRVVITVQPVWAKTVDETQRIGDELATHLSAAGFKSIRLETHPLKPMAVSAIGRS